MVKQVLLYLLAVSLIFIVFVLIDQSSKLRVLNGKISSLQNAIDKSDTTKDLPLQVIKDLYPYKIDALRSQKYFTYYTGWETFTYANNNDENKFNGCLKFQYPPSYLLQVSDDGRFFNVTDSVENSVKFNWDYMGDYCANIGCLKFDLIKLPENVVQNYSMVKLLGREEQDSLSKKEKYFVEVNLGDTGYRVGLRSINKNNFTEQLKILSTLVFASTCSELE
ncbi:hypothetical protein GW755_01695 [bacterium]|nr:hypothetical protein [bacterium]